MRTWSEIVNMISFVHLQQSTASSLFNLNAWQSFSTTFHQVLFGLPLGLAPSTSYSIHFLSPHPITVLLATHAHTINFRGKAQARILQVSQNVNCTRIPWHQDVYFAYNYKVVHKSQYPTLPRGLAFFYTLKLHCPAGGHCPVLGG